MAISEPIEDAPAPPVVRDNRTWRMQIFCEADVPVPQWRVEWLREVVQRDAQGNIVGDRVQHQVAVTEGEVTVNVPLTVGATAAELLTESFTDPQSGKTMTGAELMSMLAYVGDLRWQAQRDAVIAAAQAAQDPRE